MDANQAIIAPARTLNALEERKIVWEIIKLFQHERLSYQQAVELLEETKAQLVNIPIQIFEDNPVT